MLMVELSLAILTISGLYLFKTHLEGESMEIQCILMFFKFFLPFNYNSLSKLHSFKMVIKAMAKIVVHGH